MKTLSELDGLESAKLFLTRLFLNDQGIHAVLLYGAEGAGKSSLARLLAQSWLCTNPSESGGCGECKPCGAFLRDTSTDFLLIQPQGASRNIPVGAIIENSPRLDSDPPQWLQMFLRTGPLISRRKVVLIEDADRLNHRGANALLKTLEEPNEQAKLILTTSHVGLILPTILSRCVAVACQLPKISDPDLLFPMTDGAPGVMEAMQPFADHYGQLVEFASSLPGRQPEEALIVAAEFRGWCERLDDKRKLGARAANSEGLRLLAKLLSLKQDCVPAKVHEIIEAHRRIVGNANSTLTTDALFAKLLGGGG